MGGAIYNNYFGFCENPFSVTPDPRFFYANSLHKEAFASLQYGIKNRKGFVLITGEVGTGKTMLLRKLMRQLEATIDSVFIFNTYLNFSELLQLILHDLGLPHKESTRVAMIQDLNEYLLQQLQRDRTVSLLIDEAQNLSDESLEGLRLLSNLETDKEKLLQTVLVGQPELAAKLSKPSLRQLNQRVALRCRLDSLNESDTGNYVRHRLEVAGYRGSELFREPTIKAIWLYSRGTPRLINLICDSALVTTYATNKRFVSAAIVDEAGRDLGMETEVLDLKEEASTADIKTKISRRQIPQVLADKPLQRKREGFNKVALGAFSGAFIALLLVGVGAFFIDRMQSKDHLSDINLRIEKLLGIVQQSQKFLEDKLLSKETERENLRLTAGSQPGLPAQGSSPSHPDSNPVKSAEPIEASSVRDAGDFPPKEEKPVAGPAPRLSVKPKVADNWKDRPIVIEHGSTVSEIVNDAYPANRILAMDLLKEYNNHIENLNWVLAGQGLWLPPLSRETLLRRQPDGSYRLILGSFPNSLGAEKFSQTVRSKGYKVIVTPRRVSNDILLHRVEIDRLKSPNAANQAWNTALANTWLSFPGNSSVGGANDELSSIQHR